MHICSVTNEHANMYHSLHVLLYREKCISLIKNSLSTAKIVFVVVSGEAEFPGTLFSSDKVFCSICKILDNVNEQNMQLRLLY